MKKSHAALMAVAIAVLVGAGTYFITSSSNAGLGASVYSAAGTMTTKTSGTTGPTNPSNPTGGTALATGVSIGTPAISLDACKAAAGSTGSNYAYATYFGHGYCLLYFSTAPNASLADAMIAQNQASGAGLVTKKDCDKLGGIFIAGSNPPNGVCLLKSAAAATTAGTK